MLDAVVVGAGPAGLSISYFLSQKGCSHVVLERGRVGENWRSQRWDGFLLNSTPLRSVLPGDEYRGSDPWGAISHGEFVAYLEDYVTRNTIPVQTGILVEGVENVEEGFKITGPEIDCMARQIVVASGDQNVAKRPAWSSNLPGAVLQLDTCTYRNPHHLPEGSMLVVGSGQSGGQIAEELREAGRRVYLATSRTPRLVRRYRGFDTLQWLTISGFADTPREALISIDGRLPRRPLLGPTHTISLQSLAARGVTLLGRLLGFEAGRLQFGDDLEQNLHYGDSSSAEIKRWIDAYIMAQKLDAPPAEDDPFESPHVRLTEPPVRSLDLVGSGISTIIWCVGLTGDFSWLRVPGALDVAGQPIHTAGISPIEGLFFAGLDYAVTRRSGTVPALAKEMAELANHVNSRDHLH